MLNTRPLERTLIAALSLWPTLSLATPSELLDLSLQELTRLSVEDDYTSRSPWQVEYAYRELRLSDYRNDDESLDSQSILVQTGQPRTNQNYPIVPTQAVQRIHSVHIGYQFSDAFRIKFSLPFIEQDTDHISNMAGYENFSISSAGIGDISLLGSWRVFDFASTEWWFSAGVSLPTGSIDETADTPRPGTENILPYTKQLGSGTVDLPLALDVTTRISQVQLGLRATGRFYLGTNDRGYALGNRYGVQAWARYQSQSWIHPGLRVAYQHTACIRGQDAELLTSGAFPYPAPITDPANFGGNVVTLSLTARLCDQTRGCKHYLDLEYTEPLYQALNGIQPEEQRQIGLRFGLRF